MFHRKKQKQVPQPTESGAGGQAATGTPIEPKSIFGSDLVEKLIPHLGPEGIERLTQQFTNDTIKRWIAQQTTDVLTQEDKNRVSQAYRESGGGPGGIKIKELGSLFILAAAEKVADQVSSDTVAGEGLPADLTSDLAERVVVIIEQLWPQEVKDTLRELGKWPREKPKAKNGWTPVNPQLSCGRPLSKLQRIFIFTEGDEDSDARVMMGMLQDAAAAPVSEIRNQSGFDLITRSSVGREVNVTGSLPEGAWQAMEVMSPGITQAAHSSPERAAQVFLCTRGFEHPQTHEAGVLVLVYSE